MELGADAPWADLDHSEVSLQSLTESLRDRVPGVFVTGAPSQPLNSAVMAPLFERDGELLILLTRRSWTLRSHAGEVSFPGGRQDPGETLWETAMREADEEIALPVGSAVQIGELDRLQTISSGSSVYPFVAFVEDLPNLTPNPGEVDRILEVPLSELTAPGVFREELWSIPDWGVRPITFFELEGDTVWGATATMLRQLLCLGLGI